VSECMQNAPFRGKKNPNIFWGGAQPPPPLGGDTPPQTQPLERARRFDTRLGPPNKNPGSASAPDGHYTRPIAEHALDQFSVCVVSWTNAGHSFCATFTEASVSTWDQSKSVWSDKRRHHSRFNHVHAVATLKVENWRCVRLDSTEFSRHKTFSRPSFLVRRPNCHARHFPRPRFIICTASHPILFEAKLLVRSSWTCFQFNTCWVVNSICPTPGTRVQ